jgi:F-type H+-transporting ATPase subunit epsilon
MTQDGSPHLHLRVITPERMLVDAEVGEVALPGLDGELGILPGHRSLVTALGRGRLFYRLAGSEQQFDVAGGYAEIGPESVLVFTALSGDEEHGT